MKLTIVAGARPNFIKIAPIIRAINSSSQLSKIIRFRIVHTGQHYDKKMSDDFFDQLGIPSPDCNLGAGSGTQAEQTAAIMVQFEKELRNNPSDLVLVVGDVTSTMACAITAKKMLVQVAHVEGGIRSGDWNMPEEINRVVTDSISDYFFTTTELAGENLIRSGINNDCIFFVGNTMIDTLLHHFDDFKKPQCWGDFKLTNSNYLLLTLHRPSNVDSKEQLARLFEVLEKNTDNIPVIFPVHPRTRKNMSNFGLNPDKIFLVDPLPYLEFNYLVKNSKCVITDSGGITEETTVMGIPCMTIRDSTERPETITIGTNELIGTNPENLVPALKKLIDGKWKRGGIPPLWDGKTSERIVSHIINLFPGN